MAQIPPGSTPVQFLVDGVVIVGIELAHVVAVDDVDVAVLAGADHQVAGVAAAIRKVGQHNGSAGAEVDVGIGFLHGVVHGEVVGHRELAPSADTSRRRCRSRR